jgi:hypothetical protein
VYRKSKEKTERKKLKKQERKKQRKMIFKSKGQEELTVVQPPQS